MDLFANPSDYVVLAGLILIALITTWGIHRSNPKLAPRIKTERHEDLDIASGKYLGRKRVGFDAGRSR